MSATEPDIPRITHGPRAGLPERRKAPRCRKWRFTLSAKFILLMASLLSLALVAESVFNYRYQKVLLLESLREKAAVQGKFVSEISKEAILARDYETLNRYMEETARIDDIAFSAIVSPSGQNMTSYLRASERAVQVARRALPQGEFRALLDAIQSDPQVLTTHYPIRVGNNNIASLAIGVDTQRIESLVRAELTRQLLTHAALIAILGVVIYFAFRTSMLTRIRSLIAGAARVSEGVLDQPVAPRTNDELCDLTHSFNRMMAQLRESNARTLAAMDELRDLNRNLETRVQERTARLELAMRIAQMGHWDYDITSRRFHFSPQVCALFNVPPDAPLRLAAVLRAIHPDDRQAVWAAFTRAFTKSQTLELEFRVLVGEQARTLFAIAEHLMGEDGLHVRLFGIAQDITARVLAEHVAHTAFRETLEARSESEAKSAFLANMSHEIRTPLTAILGFAESLRDSSQPEAERQDAVTTIIDSGKHLLQVINEILDLSKIESRCLTVERLPTRLADLVRDVESVAAMLARDKHLDLSVSYAFPVPAVIETDPTRLKQILLNLCGNAVKFTPRGGVRIVIRHLPDVGLIRFDIADTGIGIPTDMLPRLCSPFVQADASTTRRFGGSGLGLYISRQLAEMLGGSLDITSTEGHGTLASVSVATGAVNAGEMLLSQNDIVPDSARAPDTANIVPLSGTVLLAEDNPLNRRLIARYIERTGAQVALAENGEMAHDMAYERPYDLILMDMQMPVLDGVTATRRLREAGYAHPIVALTANVFNEDRERAQQAGCDDFLTKPIDLPAFYRVLNTYLPQAHMPAPDARSRFDAELRDLAERFIDSLPEWMDKFQAARETQDTDEAQSLAHQLKGLGGTFGYPEISRYAGDIEKRLRANPSQEIQEPFLQLRAACDAAVTDFRQTHAAKG